MADTDKKNAEGKVLAAKIKDIKVAMMTTVDENDGILRSRPMVTQEADFDGNLWFFTQASAPKVAEAANSQVNISYSAPEDNRYVSVSGVAELVRDKKKTHEYWKPIHKIWFPGGEEDPDLALLKVTVTSAEYWDGPSNKMVQIFQIVHSLNTGKQAVGTSEKLDLD